MGFLSTSGSVFRFAAAAPARIDRQTIATAVQGRAFRELADEDDGTAQRIGWVGIHDPLCTTFTPADLFFEHYLAVSFRFDRRSVPGRLARLERRRLERERSAARGGERLGAAERREIKMEVDQRLMRRALPVPRIVDCLWNLESGFVYLTGGARSVREAFADLFRHTFGVMPIPMIPYLAAEHVGLSAHVIDQVRRAEPTILTPQARHAEVPQLPIGLKELPTP